MAPKVNVPQPSAEERELQRQQAALLAQQQQITQQAYQQQQTLLPFFAEQAGIELQFDESGKIIGATKVDDPLAAQNKEIQGLLNERSLKALRGELPVDPVLERELASQEQTLRERLTSQLGTGYETSSPGIETLDKFFQTAEGLRSTARRGELTLAEQLGLARTESDRAGTAMNLNILRGGAIADPLSFAQASGINAQGYGQAQIPFIQHRQMQLQANMQNAQNTMGLFGGIGQLAGLALGSIFPVI